MNGLVDGMVKCPEAGRMTTRNVLASGRTYDFLLMMLKGVLLNGDPLFGEVQKQKCLLNKYVYSPNTLSQYSAKNKKKEYYIPVLYRVQTPTYSIFFFSFVFPSLYFPPIDGNK